MIRGPSVKAPIGFEAGAGRLRRMEKLRRVLKISWHTPAWFKDAVYTRTPGGRFGTFPEAHHD
jgi:hypothetical protein